DGVRFEFNRRLHDDGPKTFLNQTGNWNGEDVIRILLEQEAAALFLVRKLYRFLIGETEPPPDALLRPLAEVLRRSQYHVCGVVRLMLASRHFFSAYAYRQRVKSPAGFIVGAVRAVCQPDGSVPPAALAAPLENMGQLLFSPPNVAGWPGGRTW